jgi:hypothetical protein
MQVNTNIGLTDEQREGVVLMLNTLPVEWLSSAQLSR